MNWKKRLLDVLAGIAMHLLIRFGGAKRRHRDEHDNAGV